MPRTLTLPVALYSSQAGLTLEAQPIDEDGAAVGSPITTGFAQASGVASWLWTGDVPDGAVGVAWLNAADDSELYRDALPGVQIGEAITIDMMQETPGDSNTIGDALDAIFTISGGSGFTGSNNVTIRFRDASENPIANVTFTIQGVGSGTTDGTGEITINLPDGTYDIHAIPSSGVFWSPASFEVASDDTFNFDGVTTASAGSEERSASYLVSLVRDLIGERNGQVGYRDGFAIDNDYDDQSISILRALNVRQKLLYKTGYYKCYFSFVMLIADADNRNDRYALDTRAGRIREMILTDDGGDYWPLEDITNVNLNTNNGRYRNQVSGRPTQFFVDGDLLVFNKAPDFAYPVTYLAETSAPDMVLESDTPSKLPVPLQDMLAYGAAVDLLSPRLHKEGVQAMVGVYSARWNDSYEELKRTARNRIMNSVQAASPARGARR